jgi:hypothetical protein
MKHGCTSGYCHYWQPGAGADAEYADLIDATPSETCGGLKRVVPGAPEESLLFLKVSMETPPCGTRMPRGGAALPAAEIDLVRAWIAGGALR